jgi:hypothetical protein
MSELGLRFVFDKKQHADVLNITPEHRAWLVRLLHYLHAVDVHEERLCATYATLLCADAAADRRAILRSLQKPSLFGGVTSTGKVSPSSTTLIRALELAIAQAREVERTIATATITGELYQSQEHLGQAVAQMQQYLREASMNASLQERQAMAARELLGPLAIAAGIGGQELVTADVGNAIIHHSTSANRGVTVHETALWENVLGRLKEALQNATIQESRPHSRDEPISANISTALAPTSFFFDADAGGVFSAAEKVVT